MLEIDRILDDPNTDLLLSLAARLAQADAGPPDAQIVEAFARAVRIAPYYESRLAGILAAKGYGRSLSDEGRQRIERHARKLREKDDVVQVLSSQGIDHVVVKGSRLAEQLYGAPSARLSSDLDILIDAADAQAAHSALLGLGYVQSLLFLDAGQMPRRSDTPVVKASGRLLADHYKGQDDIELQFGVHVFSTIKLRLSEMRRLEKTFGPALGEAFETVAGILFFICDKHKDLLTGTLFSIRCLVDLLAAIKRIHAATRFETFLRIAEAAGAAAAVADVISVVLRYVDAAYRDDLRAAVAPYKGSSAVLFERYHPFVFPVINSKLRRDACLHLQGRAVFEHMRNAQCLGKDHALDHATPSWRLTGNHGGRTAAMRFEIEDVGRAAPFYEFELEGFVLDGRDRNLPWEAHFVLRPDETGGWQPEIRTLSGPIVMTLRPVQAKRPVFEMRLRCADAVGTPLIVKRLRLHGANYYDPEVGDHTRLSQLDHYPILSVLTAPG